MRLVRQKAINLDSQCPATIFKCAICTASNDNSEDSKSCSHQSGCSICLDDFHSHDLVRKMPCSSNHMFHSACILTWFGSSSRCPLCNESISESKKRSKAGARASRMHQTSALENPASQTSRATNGATLQQHSEEAPPTHSGNTGEGSSPLISSQFSPRHELPVAPRAHVTQPSLIDEQIRTQGTSNTPEVVKFQSNKRNYSYIDYDQGRWSSKPS